ncbi:hypothetical protein [Azospirillum sp. sgz302134]
MNAIAMTVVKERHAAERALDSSMALGASPVGAMPLASFGETSHTPVPLKPTAGMLAAGSRAGGVSVETAWKIYLAMINEAA